MAKLTKSAILAHLAKKNEISKKQAGQIVEELVNLAYKEAKNSFTIPGLGRLTVDAVLARDYPTIQAVILLFSFVYVMINLAVDMLYTVLDPRIRY